MAFSTLRPRPRSGPPSPPTEWYGRGGGGDGDIRFPRIIWLMLALTLIGSAFGLYRIGLGLIERPLPVSAALAAGVVGAWTVGRHSKEADVCAPASRYRRAGRLRPPAFAPQLKRDPLGCTTVSGVRMRTGLTSLAALCVLVQCACAQARSRAVPFVGCAADGQQGHITPPRGQPKAVDSTNVSVEGIAYYKGDYAPGVFAPSGWRCHVWYGSSGSAVLVTPTPIDTTHSSPAHVLGPAVELSAHFGGTSGRFSVAEYGGYLFPTLLASFIARVKSEGLVPD